MPLNFIHGDITEIKADAIVNAAKNSLFGGGGVDGAIHHAAGPELLEECIGLNGCRTGEAKITEGYNLPAKHVIHTVGPVWQGGNNGEEELLRSCYRNSIQIAKDNNLSTIAFPLISSGAYGYPKDKALFVACDEISKSISDTDIEATIVFFDRPSPQLKLEEMRRARCFDDSISVNFATSDYNRINSTVLPSAINESAYLESEELPATSLLLPLKKTVKVKENKAEKKKTNKKFEQEAEKTPQQNLEYLIRAIDEDFCGMLCRLIDEKGLTDPECYRRANISRKLFSKIKCNPEYKPEKKTVLAFAVALELTFKETNEFLKKAGYAFSDCSKFDIIVCYYIARGNYNIFEINETLFEYDQVLLGSSSL